MKLFYLDGCYPTPEKHLLDVNMFWYVEIIPRRDQIRAAQQPFIQLLSATTVKDFELVMPTGEF